MPNGDFEGWFNLSAASRRPVEVFLVYGTQLPTEHVSQNCVIPIRLHMLVPFDVRFSCQINPSFRFKFSELVEGSRLCERNTYRQIVKALWQRLLGFFCICEHVSEPVVATDERACKRKG